MIVVLDASVIVHRDWRLSKPDAILLEQAIKLGKVRLVVPEIVVEEVKNKFWEELEKADLKARSEARKLNEFLSQDEKFELPEKDLDEATKKYSDELDRRLKELKAERIPYADIPHRDLVKRDLSRRRPFQQSGKGYRDSLIWETVAKKVANTDVQSIFVTGNTKDFCVENSRDLHPDLCKDLSDAKLSLDSVKIVPDLEALGNEVIKPLLPVNADSLVALREGRFKGFTFNHFLSEEVRAIQERLGEALQQGQAPTLPFELVEGATVGYIDEPDSISVEEAYELDSDRLYLKYAVVADVSLDLLIHKPDFYWLEDQYSLEVWDSDWNDHTVWAKSTMALPLTISIVLRIQPEVVVEEFDLEIGEFYGWCWNCQAPILGDAAEKCSECGKSLIRPRRKSSKIMDAVPAKESSSKN